MTHFDLENYKAILGQTDLSDQETSEMLSICYAFIRTLVQENFDSEANNKTLKNDAVFRSESAASYDTVTAISNNIEALGNKGFPAFKGMEP